MDSEAAWYWLLLLRTPGIGPTRLREALQRVKGDIRRVPADLCRQPWLRPLAKSWLDKPDRERLTQDQNWLAQAHCRLLCCTDEDFPPLLDAMAQPPAALFVQGDASLLLRPQVAIVGARCATMGGLANARHFAAKLACRGLIVTSGMADGIDAEAHRAALAHDAPTLAVMGTGPDRVYPAKHQALAADIATRGAIISEFPPGTGARADHFPRRNRLIAGLALGTLVIEAGLKSGSLITARLAAEQGREVFALPGSIHSPQARGCHYLIREGARLVETADEVFEALCPAARALGVELALRLSSTTCAAPVDISPSVPRFERLLEALGHDPVSMDELISRCHQPASVLNALLLELELTGRVASLPGNRYQRLA